MTYMLLKFTVWLYFKAHKGVYMVSIGSYDTHADYNVLKNTYD